jgi:hypothetical protein
MEGATLARNADGNVGPAVLEIDDGNGEVAGPRTGEDGIRS